MRLRELHVDGLADAALAGTHLVARASSAVLDYDASIVEVRHSFPVESGARLAGVAAGVAAWWSDDAAHLVRLDGGRQRAIREPMPLVGARLTAAGLFLAWNASDPRAPGRVRFVPLAGLS